MYKILKYNKCISVYLEEIFPMIFFCNQAHKFIITVVKKCKETCLIIHLKCFLFTVYKSVSIRPYGLNFLSVCIWFYGEFVPKYGFLLQVQKPFNSSSNFENYILGQNSDNKTCRSVN